MDQDLDAGGGDGTDRLGDERSGSVVPGIRVADADDEGAAEGLDGTHDRVTRRSRKCVAHEMHGS